MIDIRSPKFLPVLYGALVIAGIEMVPGLNFINACCCAGVLFGGFLSVFFYTQQLEPEKNLLTKNDCTEIGVWTGIYSAIFGTVMNLFVRLFFGNIAIETMLTIINRADIEIPYEINNMIDEALTTGLTFFDIVISFISNLFINTIFSILGSLIGWSVFKDKYGQKNIYF